MQAARSPPTRCSTRCRASGIAPRGVRLWSAVTCHRFLSGRQQVRCLGRRVRRDALSGQRFDRPGRKRLSGKRKRRRVAALQSLPRRRPDGPRAGRVERGVGPESLGDRVARRDAAVPGRHPADPRPAVWLVSPRPNGERGKCDGTFHPAARAPRWVAVKRLPLGLAGGRSGGGRGTDHHLRLPPPRRRTGRRKARAPRPGVTSGRSAPGNHDSAAMILPIVFCLIEAEGVGSRFRPTINHIASSSPENDSRPPLPFSLCGQELAE
jgi:hypothetical protein